MLHLHIGFHKAGSTTLQTFLRDNAAALAAAGVDYPEIGRRAEDIAHHGLSKGLKTRRGDHAELEALWRGIGERARGERTVVVSSEGLEQVDPEPLAGWLAGAPVRVIAYVRDLPSRLVSIYAQSTKRGHSTLDFDAFVARELTLDRTLSAPKLKAWADAVGAANVRVRSLDAGCLDGGEVVSDFLAAIGLGADARERLGLVAPGPLNVSPGWRTLEALRGLNADADWLDEDGLPPPDEGRSPSGALLQAALAAEARLGWGERGLYLDAGQIDEAVRINDADNAAIEALGVDAGLAAAPTPAARTFLPEASRIPAEEITAFYREVIAAMARQVMLRPKRTRRAPAGPAAAAVPEPAAPAEPDASPAKRAPGWLPAMFRRSGDRA
jgi:hypothetical protein